MPQKKYMVNSRNKGNDYERKLAQEFRDIWYSECCTSRFESKMMDDLGVDLMNTWKRYIQAKCYKNFSWAKVIETLKRMPEHEWKINTIFLKITNKWETVCMSKKDFYKLITKS